MKRAKKLLCLLLVFIMLFALAACGAEKAEDTAGKTESEASGDSASRAPVEDENGQIRLRIGTTGYLGRFLAGIAPTESHSGCDALFDTIFRVDPVTKKRKSDCLEEWYWEDEHFFIERLQEGVTFSNGQKATAEDLLYSYKSHDERGSNYLANMYLDLDKCEIRDERTVAFWCEKQNSTISRTGLYLICKSFADEVGWDSEEWYHPVTSGPYECTEYVYDDYFVLKLRDNYWKGDIDEDYYVDEIYYKYYPDVSTLYMELELGNLDLCQIQDTDMTRYLEDDSTDRHFNVVADSSGAVAYIDFGFKDNPIWYDKNLRLAFAHAVNWDELAMLMGGDLYMPANSFAPSTSDAYMDPGTWEYNPDLAKQYLAEAGYGEGELTLKATFMDTAIYKNCGQGLTYYLGEIGVNLDIQYADVSTSIASWVVAGNNDFGLMFNAGGSPEQNVRGSLHQPRNTQGVTWCYIDDDHFGELYAELCAPTITEEEEEALGKEIQQYVYDECLALPICEYALAFGYNSDIFTPQIVNDFTFCNYFQLKDMCLRSTFGK